jgi:nucleoside-diphosphate-sugar epimerase
MADVLILGGTRNLGHVTALELLASGHNVTVLNRGLTPDGLPAQVERLRADRHDTAQMRRELANRSFDLILDTTTYTGTDARQAVELFGGNTDRFIFVSTGQVYLVRENIERPFREDDYAGAMMSEPEAGTSDHDGWKYGVEKRDAEDVFHAASRASGFPVMTLRLPMVASEMDHYGRIQGYAARILDRGPLLIPEEGGLALRHVYVKDVARLVARLVGTDFGIGLAYNISYGRSMSLGEFIGLLSSILAKPVDIVRKPRAELEAEGLLPACSPFSGMWMSELDNARSIDDLSSAGLEYTPPEDYLPAIVTDYVSRWCPRELVPAGLEHRQREVLSAYPKI